MSNKNRKSFYFKMFFIFAALLSLIGCATIQPVQTITYDSNGKKISDKTVYQVNWNSPQLNVTVNTYDNLAAAQAATDDVNVTWNSANRSMMTASGNAGLMPIWAAWAKIPKPTQVNEIHLTPSVTASSSTSLNTSITQDIASTGNSTTQTPLPQSVCNMMINGQCNPNTVTAVTAVATTAVIGGITAGVITAVNNQAQQQQQQQQKNNDLMTILAIQNGQKSGSGSGSGSTCTASQHAQGFC